MRHPLPDMLYLQQTLSRLSADKLGYKTHSGVIKRMQEITRAFIKYEEEQP